VNDHIEMDNRLSYNFLKGIVGDQINIVLAWKNLIWTGLRKARKFWDSFC